MTNEVPSSNTSPDQSALSPVGGKDPQVENSLKVESNPGLVAKYTLFREKLNPKSGTIYYPCCANDISPSLAFPSSRVIYADTNEVAINPLKQAGFEGYATSALEFHPGAVDILIMINPMISPDFPSSHVVEEGYVLCNDYHGTASSLYRNEKYQLTAIVRGTKEGTLIFDTENPEDYWKEIETEEEFKNSRFSFGAANYSQASKIVEEVTGKTENVLGEYKKIIESAREELRKKNSELIAKNPGIRSILKDPENEDTFMYTHEGHQFVLTSSLPKKKGTVDDLFIFQKKDSKTITPS